jgi:hypothetical protein
LIVATAAFRIARAQSLLKTTLEILRREAKNGGFLQQFLRISEMGFSPKKLSQINQMLI